MIPTAIHSTDKNGASDDDDDDDNGASDLRSSRS